MTIRTMALSVAAVMAIAACEIESDATAVQAVAGPSVTVTPRQDPTQLALSWSAAVGAIRYNVYQSTGGAGVAFIAAVIGSPPSTSYIATGLTDGVRYCFGISSTFLDGTESEMSAVACSSGGPVTSVEQTEVYSIGFAIPGAGAQVLPGGSSGNTALILNTSTASNTLPLRTQAGRAIKAWSVRILKTSAAGDIGARLWRADPGSGAAVQIGGTCFLHAQVLTSIGQAGLSEVASASASYFIEVRGGGATGDSVQDYQLTTQ